MPDRPVRGAACAALFALLATPGLAATYAYTSLDTPSATTLGFGINAHNETTGFLDETVSPFKELGWYENGAGLVRFDAPVANKGVRPVSINDDGVILASYQKTANATLIFTYDSHSGTSTLLPVAGGKNVSPDAINNSGTVIGQLSGSTFLPPNQALMLAGGVTTLLTPPGSTGSTYAFDINDAGTVAGVFFTSAPQSHGYLYAAGTYTTFDVPGAVNGTDVYTINPEGTVGGLYVDASNVEHGYTKTGSVYTTYDYPGATSTTVVGVEKNGRVFGNWTDAAHHSHGFTVFKGAYHPLDFPGATTTSILRVNAAGSFVGSYYDAAGTVHAFKAVCSSGKPTCNR